MKSLTGILILTTVISCAAASYNTVMQFKTEDVVNACFARSINMCGDVICEGDDDHVVTLKSMWSAMDECLANPQNIDKRYFDLDYQSRLRYE